MPKEKSWAPLLLWASLLKGCNGWTSLGTTLGPTSSAPCNQNEIKNENHSFSPQLPHTHRLLPLALLSLYYFIDWASVGTGARRCTAPYFPGITLELASLPAVCGVKLKSSLSSSGTTQLQHCGRPKRANRRNLIRKVPSRAAGQVPTANCVWLHASVVSSGRAPHMSCCTGDWRQPAAARSLFRRRQAAPRRRWSWSPVETLSSLYKVRYNLVVYSVNGSKHCQSISMIPNGTLCC